ncbi:hypothetical protein BGX33_000252, partial [Mortierella sp. NVP41]
LEPRRIAVIQNTVLDIIVEDPLVPPGDSRLQATTPKASGERSQETPQTTLQKSTQEAGHNKAVTPKRNPVYGLEDEAMANYNHIDHPDAVSLLRRPQVISSDRQHDGNGDQTTEIQSENTINRPRAPQDQTAAATTNDLTPIIAKATLGDRDAQVCGDPSAQNIVGDLYRLGEGVPQDFSAAMDWYYKAAEEGDAEGQYRVAQLYDYGLGVPQDFEWAMDWYLKAADQGYAPAQSSIGDLSPAGLHPGLKWYHKAADQNLAQAQFWIAQIHEHGQDVSQDRAVALEWYNKTIKNGETDGWGPFTKGYLYRDGIGVPRDPSEAFEWFLKAAQQVNIPAFYELGIMYYKGLGVPQDYSKAKKWLLKSASHGRAIAQHQIGIMYNQGDGVRKNPSRAFQWFLKAAHQGPAVAQLDVGRMYRLGDVVPQDYYKAMEWLRKAADQRLSSAQHEVGLMYVYSHSVSRSYSDAISWFFDAAWQGYAGAQYEFGMMYCTGQGVT